MSEQRVPIRQPRLLGPSTRTSAETWAIEQHVRSAAEVVEEKLRDGLRHADELADEFGEVTTEERQKLLEIWPVD